MEQACRSMRLHAAKYMKKLPQWSNRDNVYRSGNVLASLRGQCHNIGSRGCVARQISRGRRKMKFCSENYLASHPASAYNIGNFLYILCLGM